MHALCSVLHSCDQLSNGYTFGISIWQADKKPTKSNTEKKRGMGSVFLCPIQPMRVPMPTKISILATMSMNETEGAT